MGGLYLAYNGFCFVQYDADGSVVPYIFTDSNIAATDRMAVEE